MKVITLVRTHDRMVFEIDGLTLEPKSASHYDAFCFTDPRTDVVYMDHIDWLRKRNGQFSWKK